MPIAALLPIMWPRIASLESPERIPARIAITSVQNSSFIPPWHHSWKSVIAPSSLILFSELKRCSSPMEIVSGPRIFFSPKALAPISLVFSPSTTNPEEPPIIEPLGVLTIAFDARSCTLKSVSLVAKSFDSSIILPIVPMNLSRSSSTTFFLCFWPFVSRISPSQDERSWKATGSSMSKKNAKEVFNHWGWFEPLPLGRPALHCRYSGFSLPHWQRLSMQPHPARPRHEYSSRYSQVVIIDGAFSAVVQTWPLHPPTSQSAAVLHSRLALPTTMNSSEMLLSNCLHSESENGFPSLQPVPKFTLMWYVPGSSNASCLSTLSPGESFTSIPSQNHSFCCTYYQPSNAHSES